jgi:hypothetical protein
MVNVVTVLAYLACQAFMKQLHEVTISGGAAMLRRAGFEPAIDQPLRDQH